MNQIPDADAPRVLLVDDDDALRDAMAYCLRRAGFAVVAVGTGADALAAARTIRPRAAIIDLILPDAGGPGVADAVRRERGLESLPVLFTTALSPQHVAPALPRESVLFKPFTREELVEWVSSLVGAGHRRARTG